MAAMIEDFITDCNTTMFQEITAIHNVEDLQDWWTMRGLVEPMPQTMQARIVVHKEQNIAERIRQAALDQNVLTYPTQGCVDGINGDHILLAPPFTISQPECAQIARALHCALQKVFPS